MLLDLEEEEPAPLIRDTPPVNISFFFFKLILMHMITNRLALISLQVQLTRTPEYFNFWEGKPLLKRDWGVPTHKRKQWHRPKSDYGSRFASRKKKGDGSNEGQGSGLLGSGLETLLERDDGSTLGSDTSTRRGSRDFGALGGDGAGGRGLGTGDGSGDNDASKLSVSGEGLNSRSGSRRGSKDFGGTGRGKDDRLRRTRHVNY